MTSQSAPEEASGQLLIFGIDREIFGLPVDHVREVVDPPPMTSVPNAPGHAPGIVNVRGNVVPVVDLRRRLGFDPANDEQRMIVSEIQVQGEATVVGILADTVHGVTDIAHAQVENIPRIGTRWRPEFIRGVAKQGDRFIVLLDIDRVLALD